MRLTVMLAALLLPGFAVAAEPLDVRQSLEQYQRVAFAQEMSARCRFHAGLEAMEYEWNAATAYGALRKNEDAAEMTQIIKETANEAANSDRYACGPALQEVSLKGFEESRLLLAGLDADRFDAETSYRELLTGYLANVAAATAIEERCRLLEPGRRQELSGAFRAALDGVERHLGRPAIDEADKLAQVAVNTIAKAHCGAAMRPFLGQLFTDLDRLQRGLGYYGQVEPSALRQDGDR